MPLEWSDERIRQARVSLAYNGFTAVTNPVSGEVVHIVGIWLQYPANGQPEFQGNHYLIRPLDGTYEGSAIDSVTPPLEPGGKPESNPMHCGLAVCIGPDRIDLLRRV